MKPTVPAKSTSPNSGKDVPSITYQCMRCNHEFEWPCSGAVYQEDGTACPVTTCSSLHVIPVKTEVTPRTCDYLLEIFG